MNWDDLKYFLAVAREGQILRASKKLDVSQATLNRRISNLEQALGKKLFDRSTTGCMLLPPGQVLLAHAERVESEMIQTTGGGYRHNDRATKERPATRQEAYRLLLETVRLARLSQEAWNATATRRLERALPGGVRGRPDFLVRA